MLAGLRVAIAMFTVAPVPRSWHAGSAARARHAVLWLPFVGGALGALAGLAATVVLDRATGAGLLAAVIAVVLLAAFTRALHLDGLADTVDGLASRAPRERALAIMAQSDIGPFGVAAVVGVLLLDVAALDTATGTHLWRAPAALAVAAATGRLAVVLAALPGAPAARPGGFGSLVAGGVRPLQAAALTVLVVAGGGALAAWADAPVAGWVVGQLCALALAVAVRTFCVRRLGGVTGDVFGCLVEVTTAATLVALALS